MDKKRERIDDLTDDEIDSRGIEDAPYIECCDVRGDGGCCLNVTTPSNRGERISPSLRA
jgi:hypothetical protein